MKYFLLLLFAIFSEASTIKKFGNVFVDKGKATIYIDGTVKKREGWVQFLLYASGYKWLEEKSAVILDANLSDIQLAIAFLDWRAWEELWWRRREKISASFKVFLQYNKKMIEASQLLKTKDTLYIFDLIFLGHPLFDQAALSTHYKECAKCPLFPIEKKVLEEDFKRPSKESGYLLKKEKLPPIGKKIKLIIKKSGH